VLYSTEVNHFFKVVALNDGSEISSDISAMKSQNISIEKVHIQNGLGRVIISDSDNYLWVLDLKTDSQKVEDSKCEEGIKGLCFVCKNGLFLEDGICKTA